MSGFDFAVVADFDDSIDVDLARVAVQRFKGMVQDVGEWLLSDRKMMIVALEGRSAVGWVYGYELPRLDRDERVWLLTNESNKAAMALYAGGERPNNDDVMFRFPPLGLSARTRPSTE